MSSVKLILVGDAAVGKTSLINVLMGKEMAASYVPTAAPDFHVLQLNHNGSVVNLQMWDTAGQELYRSITHMYCRGCHIVLCCYEITRRKSFENIDSWIDMLGDEAQKASVVLIGTKSDLMSTKQGDKVSIGELQAKAENVRYRYIQTSAMTKEGIEELKLMIAEIAAEVVLRIGDTPQSSFIFNDMVSPQKVDKCC
jgi:small GTP-binding protein